MRVKTYGKIIVKFWDVFGDETSYTLSLITKRSWEKAFADEYETLRKWKKNGDIEDFVVNAIKC